MSTLHSYWIWLPGLSQLPKTMQLAFLSFPSTGDSCLIAQGVGADLGVL